MTEPNRPTILELAGEINTYGLTFRLGDRPKVFKFESGNVEVGLEKAFYQNPYLPFLVISFTPVNPDASGQNDIPDEELDAFRAPLEQYVCFVELVSDALTNDEIVVARSRVIGGHTSLFWPIEDDVPLTLRVEIIPKKVSQ